MRDIQKRTHFEEFDLYFRVSVRKVEGEIKVEPFSFLLAALQPFCSFTYRAQRLYFLCYDHSCGPTLPHSTFIRCEIKLEYRATRDYHNSQVDFGYRFLLRSLTRDRIRRFTQERFRRAPTWQLRSDNPSRIRSILSMLYLRQPTRTTNCTPTINN